VQFSDSANRGTVTVRARDESHRQHVLKTIKKNIKTKKIDAKATCWLSTLQRANKNFIYTSAQVHPDKLKCIDWGDRVAITLIAPGAPADRPERFIVDTSLPEARVKKLLTSCWDRWGLPALSAALPRAPQPATRGTAGRQDRADHPAPSRRTPPPPPRAP